MTRQLRPRRSKPDYAFLAPFDIEDEPTAPGPSNRAQGVVFDGGRELFDVAAEGTVDDEDSEFDDDEDAKYDGIEEDEPMEIVHDPEALLELPVPQVTSVLAPPSVSKGKGKASSTKNSRIASNRTSTTPSLARTARRQQYSLPTPSVHHRHRAIPLCPEPMRVERLASPPKPFGPNLVTWTNGFTSSSKVTDHVQKAWGYNVGDGPIWELVEDRGWYKEGYKWEEPDEGMNETRRRPRVYQDVKVKNGWVLLAKEDAAKYLPTDTTTTDEGELRPPPPVQCYFGPFGEQTKYEMKVFDTLRMSTLFQDNESLVFNAGAPVWGIDWCPIHPDDREGRGWQQYLAVAPYPSSAHFPQIGIRVSRPSPACIQIWSLGPSPSQSEANVSDMAPTARCELVICQDGGPAFELKWCPLPSHDLCDDQIRPRKLGLLGGTFEDGSFAVYAVPDHAGLSHNNEQPVFVKLPEPLLRIELEETACWSFDWANSEVVAIGTTNGIIAVYNIGPALRKASDPNTATVTDLLPTHYLSTHQSAIRALCWIKAPPSWPSGAVRKDGNPTIIASGGYDGVGCMTDIRDGHGSVMNRTRDVINTIVYSPYAGGVITLDHENIIKMYSASPSMLGRGHTLMDPQGPVWSVSASDYHPQLAAASADGACTTANVLRATRRGGSVPFFVHQTFKMDYNRKTGEYRMLEHLLPQEMQERTGTSLSSNKKPTAAQASSSGTGVWPWQVGVQRVAWNNGNGLASCGLLASATASGLCRVDNLWGRWIKNRVPYGSIDNIRGEAGAAMDVDSDESR